MHHQHLTPSRGNFGEEKKTRQGQGQGRTSTEVRYSSEREAAKPAQCAIAYIYELAIYSMYDGALRKKESIMNRDPKKTANRAVAMKKSHVRKVITFLHTKRTHQPVQSHIIIKAIHHHPGPDLRPVPTSASPTWAPRPSSSPDSSSGSPCSSHPPASAPV